MYRYKADLLAAAKEKPIPMLQPMIGPRKFGGTREDGATRVAEKRVDVPPATGLMGSFSARDRRSVMQAQSQRDLLEGLQHVVHGEASAELAAASSDMGTTITECFTQMNYLEPANPKAASARGTGACQGGACGRDESSSAPSSMLNILAERAHETASMRFAAAALGLGARGSHLS
jgi:hypothetical protein